VYATPAWQTPLPVPTCDRTDPRWKSRGFWRGDVWPSTNYQIACGFADYEFKDIAADIADKTVANAIKNGINEHYDSVTGEGIGIKDYCMSSTIGTMMLDGLTKKHTVKLRK
jgi:glycogen debranching enzyme